MLKIRKLGRVVLSEIVGCWVKVGPVLSKVKVVWVGLAHELANVGLSLIRWAPYYNPKSKGETDKRYPFVDLRWNS